MHNLTDLIDKWENSVLSFKEAETIINLLIIDNRRLEEELKEIKNAPIELVDGTKPKYRHFKGGIYTYICDATLEWCPDAPNSHVIIYQGEDGRRWVRSRNDFFGYTEEGNRRFEEIPDIGSLPCK